ncbi:MAG: hypothetical protein V8T45_06760 [Oscillospiraceae bacterium]
MPDYDKELFIHKKSQSGLESSKQALELMLQRFEALESWDEESIMNAMLGPGPGTGGEELRVVMWPVRIAAAGKAVTPGGAVEICPILGREEFSTA